MKIWGWKQFSIIYLFVNFSGYFVTICCHLFEKGIMTEQFDTKRSRLIMGQSSLSSHNHALITWKQNMLYRAAKVDFWQAIPPLWQPHQRAATATAGFYFTKSMQSSRSYLLWRPSIILLRRLKVAILKFSLIILSIMYMLQLSESSCWFL